MKKEVSYKIVSLVFSVLVICFLAAFYVLGWTEPTAVPPGGNVPAPINVGADTQIKSGRLGIGSLTGVDTNYGLTVGTGLGLKITATGDRIPLFVEDDSPDSTPFIIDASGNVGIGTTSPGVKLEVVGAIRGGSFSELTANSGEAWFGRAADRTLGTMTFQLGGTSATNTKFEIVDRAWTKVMYEFSGEAPAASLVVNASGNVGIGTPNPGATLEVAGQIKITGGTPGAGKVLTSDASGLSSWQAAAGGVGGIGVWRRIDMKYSAYKALSDAIITMVTCGHGNEYHEVYVTDDLANIDNRSATDRRYILGANAYKVTTIKNGQYIGDRAHGDCLLVEWNPLGSDLGPEFIKNYPGIDM